MLVQTAKSWLLESHIHIHITCCWFYIHNNIQIIQFEINNQNKQYFPLTKMLFCRLHLSHIRYIFPLRSSNWTSAVWPAGRLPAAWAATTAAPALPTRRAHPQPARAACDSTAWPAGARGTHAAPECRSCSSSKRKTILFLNAFFVLTNQMLTVHTPLHEHKHKHWKPAQGANGQTTTDTNKRIHQHTDRHKYGNAHTHCLSARPVTVPYMRFLCKRDHDAVSRQSWTTRPHEDAKRRRRRRQTTENESFLHDILYNY